MKSILCLIGRHKHKNIDGKGAVGKWVCQRRGCGDVIPAIVRPKRPTTPEKPPRDVEFIGGPLNGKIFPIKNDEVAKLCIPVLDKKCCFGFPDERGFGEFTYKIVQLSTGQWVGV